MAQARLDNSTMRLCDQLNSALLTCKINNRMFLPENCLKVLVNVSSIRAELKAELGCQMWFNPQLAEKVYKKASKVFAILVMISQVGAMKDLHQEGLTDEHLPLRRRELEPNVLESPSSGKGFKSFARYAGSARLFDEMQWQVQAPVLDMSGKHVTLDEKCALPIVVVEDELAKEGGSSSIFKGTLHEAHCEGLEVSTLPELCGRQRRLKCFVDKRRKGPSGRHQEISPDKAALKERKLQQRESQLRRDPQTRPASASHQSHRYLPDWRHVLHIVSVG
jgi:hypothetical protein